MKIAVTGANHSLGKNIADTLGSTHEVLRLDKRIENYTNTICSIVGECDVFINCGYKDKVQTDLFEDVFNLWKYEKKTIVNILTSALIFNGPNKKYIEDKQDLESKTFEVRSSDKEVRIINVYPNTLENTQIGTFTKLKFGDVSNLIKLIIELPHDIEIFQIGISKTKQKVEISII
jgi:NADP-dependent 3-hydroxy acid dehydrogenase YdfG